MDALAAKLSALPLFTGLPEADVRAAALMWEERSLQEGARLWEHGEPAGELGVLLSGRLRAHIDARTVGEVTAGEVVGEAAAWMGGLRTASVQAEVPSTLAILQTDQLSQLRSAHAAVYDCLLQQALLGLAGRIRQVDREIAKLAYGEGSAPGRRPQGRLAELWQRLTSGSPGSPPAARQALRAIPTLRIADDETMKAIEAALTARHLSAGASLFLEGDPGDSVFVIADGCIDVIRHVRGGRGERLASLYPGALLGTGSLLLGERRNASCVAAASTACWVFEMNPRAFRALGGEPGRAWRESILEALRFQISRADEQLARLKGSRATEAADYERVRAGLV
ncbi:MAG: CRP-like cAMP-binding protein [Myxococcota bacterium]|jgi:CRP-like cAMP-binding protein